MTGVGTCGEGSTGGCGPDKWLNVIGKALEASMTVALTTKSSQRKLRIVWWGKSSGENNRVEDGATRVWEEKKRARGAKWPLTIWRRSPVCLVCTGFEYSPGNLQHITVWQAKFNVRLVARVLSTALVQPC